MSMCCYSPFLIFYALILLTQISKGNALKCYECQANSTDLDAASKNCLDGNEKVPIKEFTPLPDFRVACGILKRQLRDGYEVARLGYDNLPGNVGNHAFCTSMARTNPANGIFYCELCETDFCNGNHTSGQDDTSDKAGEILHQAGLFVAVAYQNTHKKIDSTSPPAP